MKEYEDLINDEVEMELRRRVRKILEHHGIIDGVVEADLVAIIKPCVVP